MVRFLLRLVVSAVAVLVAQTIFPTYIEVAGLGEALLFAFVLGLMNALIRPILLLVTCPLTLLTLGLFIFVVNALVFWLTTWLPLGVQVSGFAGALIGSLAVSAASLLANRLHD